MTFTQFYGIFDQDAAADFHPTDLASAVAVWEADVTVEDSTGSFPTDGEEVYSWIDQTTNTYDLARNTSGPLYETTTGVNSAESLIWAAAGSDVLEIVNTNILSATGAWHVFIVCNYNTANSNTTYLFSQGDSNNNDGAALVILRQVGITLRIRSQILSDGTYPTVTVDNNVSSYSGADLLFQMYRNGATVGTVVNGTTITSTTNVAHNVDQNAQFALGAVERAGTYENNYQGAIAAVYVFNTQLTGTDLTDVKDYINTKYGV